MSVLNPTLIDHITSVCDANQIQPFIAIPDSKIIRYMGDVGNVQSVTVYFLPKEISQNFLAEAALLLPLMGGVFDKQLKCFSLVHNDLEKPTPFKVEDVTYNVQYLPIYTLVRMVSKGELTSVLAVLHHHHCFNSDGRHLISILSDLATNISPKAICDNIASEMVLVASTFTQMKVIGYKHCCDILFGYAFLAEYKRSGFMLERVRVTPEMVRVNSPILRLLEQASMDYPQFTTDLYVKVDNDNFTIYRDNLKQMMDWLYKEQSRLSFPEKELPVDTFFKRFTEFIKKAIKLV